VLPFSVAVGVWPVAGVTERLTSVSAASSAPLFTALPPAVTEAVPEPVLLIVSTGLPVVSEPVEDPPVLPPVFEPLELFEPLEPLLPPFWFSFWLGTTTVVPSPGVMVVVVPFSATMMITVLSPPLALRVMVPGHSPVRNTS